MDLIIDFDLSKIDEYDTDYLVRVLIAADDMYHNGEQSFIDDDVYDATRLYTQKLVPHHVYFTGVGSDVRGGKIKLPYQMGSLDQVEIGEIENWVNEWSLKDEYVIITDKLDGTSAMVIYDDEGDLQIAYSRGNGVEGADITRHIKHLVPANIGRPAVIRGEVIIPKSHFERSKTVAKARSGDDYKNARNMVAGLMNAKSNPKAIYKHIHFVAYDVLGTDAIDKINMLRDLQDWGFDAPCHTFRNGYELTDDHLADYIEERRAATDYEIDGLVLDVNLAAKRAEMNPTRDTLNPAYAIKYKVADASNMAVATVIGVHWNVSKHGYLKPRVEIEPVELVGVTVRHATGFNAKFIRDNMIGPGAKIQITRSGDVIPFILDVVEQAGDWQYPDQPWEWNETEVDALLLEEVLEENDEVRINRMVDFFASIEAPFLKKGNVEKLYNDNVDPMFSVEDVIMASEPDLVRALGENGKKVYKGLHDALDDIPLWKLMGSTHFFGRGVGKRKFKKLLSAVGYRDVFLGEANIEDAEGFDEKTARKIEQGMADFLAWLSPLEEDGLITVIYEEEEAGDKLAGEKVVFTGFRDKELQALAEANGATMQSSVSGKTTILVAGNPNSNSGKMKKARDLGVRVMGIDDFRGLL